MVADVFLELYMNNLLQEAPKLSDISKQCAHAFGCETVTWTLTRKFVDILPNHAYQNREQQSLLTVQQCCEW